ncbi:hypothetical protein PQ689_05925 [Thermoanaerobacterium thermosaccharolyticum]
MKAKFLMTIQISRKIKSTNSENYYKQVITMTLKPDSVKATNR